MSRHWPCATPAIVRGGQADCQKRQVPQRQSVLGAAARRPILGPATAAHGHHGRRRGHPGQGVTSRPGRRRWRRSRHKKRTAGAAIPEGPEGQFVPRPLVRQARGVAPAGRGAAAFFIVAMRQIMGSEHRFLPSVTTRAIRSSGAGPRPASGARAARERRPGCGRRPRSAARSFVQPHHARGVHDPIRKGAVERHLVFVPGAIAKSGLQSADRGEDMVAIAAKLTHAQYSANHGSKACQAGWRGLSSGERWRG